MYILYKSKVCIQVQVNDIHKHTLLIRKTKGIDNHLRITKFAVWIPTVCTMSQSTFTTATLPPVITRAAPLYA